ncbi:response regulator transcription factor [Macrococcoides canis]|uniref:KDP operon transcriptional regulatory protein KdpE n=1 Tax=Macrococcoides canis TaxID=1855823 RepID=A0A1W7A8N8_9STAP|nr:response regulator transcription factor [Macrococcus canis]ARQ05928.1 KDP operon transcriptional regulatory protein KdpE [Macrococcus canis]MCO4095987.1 response regulator transcription factor [Macrococcus canis]QCT73866.1 response regulator transcription factor [Macrococcus canis]QIH77284.1 response regulator [Macrococcus canis]QNR06895.1 response regulator [Macrococcus canis]
MKQKILLIEDDKSVQLLLTRIFEKQQYMIKIAADGKTGIFEVHNFLPDLIILDLGLPDMDGLEVINKVKQLSDIPILVLSARADSTEKVSCLDLGAEDYVTKPFDAEELLARVRVLIRRHLKINDQEMQYTNGALFIDYEAHKVYVADQMIHLTPIEYRLLVLLSRNTGKVLTYNYILKEIWGQVMESELPSLRVFMTTLRKKIEIDPKNPEYIETHMSVGYQMNKVN